MQIVDVVIESFEDRYSAQWADWFRMEYRKAGVSYYRVAPSKQLTSGIESGSFLDVHGTNFYKAAQLQDLVSLLYHKVIKDGDWVFFHDLWFPGVEMLAYIRDASGVKFKIAGCLHAGSWDKADFVNRMGMREWALHFEKSMLRIADLVFVATEFHEQLILDSFSESMHLERKIVVTGFPIYPEDFVRGMGNSKERNLVLFPHRLDAEKCPEAFDALADALRDTDLKFVRTRDVCKTKAEYYALLRQGRYAVSFAQQETWGIAMQEALFSGCIPLVPARLSYCEMYAPQLQFTSHEQLEDTLLDIQQDVQMRDLFEGYATQTAFRLGKLGRTAIPKMINVMQNWSVL